jgi:hypothetical protein
MSNLNAEKISINGLDLLSLRTLLNLELQEFSYLTGIDIHVVKNNESQESRVPIEKKPAHIIIMLCSICKFIDSDHNIAVFSSKLKEKLTEGRSKALEYMLKMPKTKGAVWNFE